MIINYVICICLSIWSTIKLVDLYQIQSKKNEEIISQFEKYTQKLIQKNDKGFGTLLGLTLTMLFSLIIYLFLLKLDIEHRELINRSNSYLCYKNYNAITLDYIKKINTTNIAIASMTVVGATVILSAEAETAIKALHLSQSFIHFSYLKKINSIPYCSLFNRTSFINSLPYMTSAVVTLKRNFDQTAIIRNHSWSIKIGNIPERTRFKKLFHLQIDYSLKNNFDISPQSRVSEIKMVSLKSKLPSGYASIFL